MSQRTATDTLPLFPSLDPPEIDSDVAAFFDGGDTTHNQGIAERFRHSGWQRQRALVYDSLVRTMQSTSRIVSWDNCGVSAFVYKSKDEPHDFRLGGSGCRDRFCLPCARDRSRCLATNVLNAIGDKPTRFITLTLKQNDNALARTIDRLYTCFGRLRQCKFWKEHVRGGCAFLELKWSCTREAWNVHLHLVVHGKYIPQSALSGLWYRITGDSPIVDVRFVHDSGRVGRYVTKYVSKPLNNTFVNRKELLDEVVTATVRRRLCLTFGDWRGIKLTESPNDRDWISIGSFHDVLTKAVDGDAESLEAIHQICRESAADVLDVVASARAPPEQEPNASLQYTFTWPAIDARF